MFLPDLPRLMVAPNGAFRQKSDHLAVPMTIDELIACAAACAEAGADGMHFHLRDPSGAHLLDVRGYQKALSALQAAEPRLAYQITTEAAGRYGADHQKTIALETGAALVSASVRELMRDGAEGFTPFHAECHARNTCVQHILYDLDDFTQLQTHLPPEQFHDPRMQLLFVLGRYSARQVSDPKDLSPFLEAMAQAQIRPDWAICAFGQTEVAALTHAHHQGGKLRVGFENSVFLSNGEIARDNAEKVTDLCRNLAQGAMYLHA